MEIKRLDKDIQMNCREDYYNFSHYYLPHIVFNFTKIFIYKILKNKDGLADTLMNTWSGGNTDTRNEKTKNEHPHISIDIKKLNDVYSLILFNIKEAKHYLETPYLGVLFDTNYKVRYFTFEIDFEEKSYLLCEWTPVWNHIAYSFHKQASKDIFIEGIKKICEEGTGSK